MSKPRVLIVYDVPGWAQQRRADALVKYAPNDLTIHSCSVSDAPSGNIDLLFLLDNASLQTVQSRMGRDVTTVVSWNAGPSRRPERVAGVAVAADWIVFNNRQAFNAHPGIAHACFVPNGCDGELFRPPKQQGNRVLWCGSATKAGKGYREIIQPLGNLLAAQGISHDFRSVDKSAVLSTAEQVAWYHSGAIILGASEPGFEATPNTITEGVACGCVAVSTTDGNIADWGEHEYNCFLVQDRTPEGFAKAIQHALGPVGVLHERRDRGLCEIRWVDYRRHARHFYNLFRRLTQNDPPMRFAYDYETGAISCMNLTYR